VTLDVKNLSAKLRGDNGRVILSGDEAGVSMVPGSFNEADGTMRFQLHGGEAVIRRPFFSEPFMLKLNVEDGAVDVSRLDAGTLHLLADHDASTASTIGVGVPGSFQAEPKPSVLFKLDDAPASDPNSNTIRKLKAGILRGGSVGADWLDEDVTVEKNFSDGMSLMTVNRWELKEYSVTPLPASPSAGALSDNPGAAPQNQEVGMKTPEELAAEQKALEDAMGVKLSAAKDEGNEAGRLAEKARQDGILHAAKLADMSGDELVTKLIADDVTVADASKQLLEKLAADRKQPIDTKGASLDVSTPGAKTIADLAADAIAIRSGVTIKDADPRALRMSTQNLVGIGREVLRAGGIDVSNMSDQSVVSRQLSLERQAQLAGHVTDDFPSVYANVIEKIASPAYAEAEPTYREWASKVNVPHPNTTKIIRLSGLPELPEIPEGGDAKMVYGKDEYENHGVKHRGHIVSITEEMIMGDQIGMINMLTRKQGSAAASTENTVAYGQLTGNPTLSDGIALFHASHSNYVASGSGAAPSQTTLGAAIQAMMLQTFTLPDGSEQDLAIQPKVLVTGVALMTAVEALMSQLYMPTASTGVITNRMRGLTHVVDSKLDAANPKGWYLLADPVATNPVVYGYANGREGLQLKTDEHFESGAIRYKVGIWFGATACDWRGAYYNYGE